MLSAMIRKLNSRTSQYQTRQHYLEFVLCQKCLFFNLILSYKLLAYEILTNSKGCMAATIHGALKCFLEKK